VRREKFYKRFGTPWSLDQELVANRLYSKTRVMSAAPLAWRQRWSE
jgi:hypothetical protein